MNLFRSIVACRRDAKKHNQVVVGKVGKDHSAQRRTFDTDRADN